MKSILLQPHVYHRIQRGVDQIANALRPTLGPLPRHVVVDRLAGGNRPHHLDDGGAIARRLIELPDRDENVGAMLIRHMIGQLHDSVGDGTVTAAIIFQNIFAEGVRYIANGGNAMRLRLFLEYGASVIDEELDRISQPICSREALVQVAGAICHDTALAANLGEAVHVIGQYGRLDVRAGGREDRVEFVEGLYWEGGSLALALVEGFQNYRVSISDAAVLVSDLEIEDPRELAELIAQVVRMGKKAFFMIASKLSEKATGLVKMVNEKPGIRVITAKPAFADYHRRITALQDLALLTGGRLIVTAAGQTLASIKAADLGSAQTVWTDRHLSGLSGGGGDPLAIRRHVAQLRALHAELHEVDKQQQIRERIGNFMGGSATLWVGGATQLEVEQRKEAAQRAARSIQGALRDGAVPGGCVALLTCAKRLREVKSHDEDERAAYRILACALMEPFRVMLSNAGYEPGCAIRALEASGYRRQFDLMAGTLTKPTVLDSASVQRAIAHFSINSAALSLTIDAIVHGRNYDHESRLSNSN